MTPNQHRHTEHEVTKVIFGKRWSGKLLSYVYTDGEDINCYLAGTFDQVHQFAKNYSWQPNHSLVVIILTPCAHTFTPSNRQTLLAFRSISLVEISGSPEREKHLLKVPISGEYRIVSDGFYGADYQDPAVPCFICDKQEYSGAFSEKSRLHLEKPRKNTYLSDRYVGIAI